MTFGEGKNPRYWVATRAGSQQGQQLAKGHDLDEKIGHGSDYWHAPRFGIEPSQPSYGSRQDT